MTPSTVTWPLEPQTQVKHEILRGYLGGWFGVMGHSVSKALFFDGFAGPGQYSDGSPGSPLIALDVLRRHQALNSTCEFLFLFNEQDPARFQHLQQLVNREKADRPLPDNVKVILGNSDFQELSKEIADGISAAKGRLAPTFAFLDPFGYSGLTMAAIERLFSWSKMDLLVYLDTNSLKRFATSGQVDIRLTELFGTDEYKKAPRAGDRARLPFLIDLYASQLKARCGFAHSQTFQMRNSKGQPIYNLVYATGHSTGLRIIKDAMWKVAPDGSFAFDARHANQDMLPIAMDTAGPLSVILEAAHHGHALTVANLEDYVLVSTRFLKGHLRGALRVLEAGNRISVSRDDKPRTANTYPPDCTVQFLPN